MASNENANARWAAMAKASLAKAALVKPPEPPSAAQKAAHKAEMDSFQRHLRRLVPALKTAPIYIVSTHGAYDLRNEPVRWVVPENTYIFETQSIGDTTLTKIDNLLWKLCLAKYRPAFFHYFMGNRWFFNKNKVNPGEPKQTYMELFRNLILYKPGDSIYERELSIGGGHKKEADGSARDSYVNMGFYKFSVNPPTPDQAPPKKTTKRPMAPTEIAGLDAMRTALVSDEDFSMTNKQVVELINNGTPIKYAGLKDGKKVLIPPVSFTLENDGEPIRIFIFSSCAAVNCNPPWDKTLNDKAAMAKFNAEKMGPLGYKSKWCKERMALIEKRQRDAALELMAMGIGTGPGGHGWDLDLERLRHVISDYKLRPKVKKGAVGVAVNEKFVPDDYEELFAEIDGDIAEWWKQVEEDGETPADIDANKKQEKIGGRRTRKPLRKGRKTRKN